MELVETDAHPMDSHVGRRLQLRRKALNMSQKSLAERIGVTFQQVQKYERAANRVSAGKLHDIARILGVPIYYFFSGFPGLGGLAEEGSSFDHGSETDAQAQELLRYFRTIENEAVRKRILELVKTLKTDPGT
jgi:transcriptional regulator with XRE-family HTH domain